MRERQIGIGRESALEVLARRGHGGDQEDGNREEDRALTVIGILLGTTACLRCVPAPLLAAARERS